MKHSIIFLLIGIMVLSCKHEPIEEVKSPDVRILFLHHSTGRNVWQGEKKMFSFLSERHNEAAVPWLISEYNKQHGTKYAIVERNFPNKNPYGWKNYPYDYYNIWVKHAGNEPYMDEPTLEMLTKEYNVIIFKHCFPVSNIKENESIASAESNVKTLANYKLQYDSLKIKLNSFPQTKFIVWTGAALVQASTNEQEAKNAREFARWVIEEWDKPGDNIEIFDFRDIETEGGLYLKPEYAVDAKGNSHPNEKISEKAAKMLVEKIINTIKQQ